MSDGTKPLKNPQHENFCHEFVKGNNGTQAYLKVYSTKSSQSARASAAKLLAKDSVSKRISHLKSKLASKLEIDNEWIMKQLANIVLANMKEVVSWNEHSTSLTPSDQISDETASAITEVSITYSEGKGESDQMIVNQKVKMSDKVRALGEMGKILNYKNQNGDKSNDMKVIEELIKMAKGKTK